MGSWILSDNFRPVPPGPDPLSDWENFWRVALQIIFPLFAISCLAWIARDCIRQRKFTFDAKLWVAFVLQFWLDPVPNFLRPQVLFNSHYVNFGSWVEHIPGWMSPNGANLPNSLLLELPIFGFLIVAVWLACWVMHRVHQRLPKLNACAMLFISVLVIAVFTFVLEWVMCIKTGWLAWSGAIPAVTLWAGTKEQMPLTECAFVGAWISMAVALRYYRDDKGQSFVERGLDKIKIPGGWKQALSVFAIIGYGQLSFMLYNVLSIPLALYIGPTPEGYPSYMTNRICGAESGYECPGPDVPLLIPRPENNTIGTDW